MTVYVVKYYNPDVGLCCEAFSCYEEAKRVRDDYVTSKIFDLVGLEDIVVDRSLTPESPRSNCLNRLDSLLVDYGPTRVQASLAAILDAASGTERRCEPV